MNSILDYFKKFSEYKQDSITIDVCHTLFLFGAALARKPRNILELGVGRGFITRALIAAVKYNGGGKITCVDNLCDGCLHDGSDPDLFPYLEREGVKVIRQSEKEFIENCPENSYDFLVSDADHENSGLWVEKTLDIVQYNGFLFFHDVQDAYPNSERVIQEVRRRGLPHFYFHESSRPEEKCHRGWFFVINVES